MNSRERQPMKRCQTCGKHEREREQEGSTRHVDWSILAHLSESIVPADHEAQSHVKEEKAAAGVKELSEGTH